MLDNLALAAMRAGADEIAMVFDIGPITYAVTQTAISPNVLVFEASDGQSTAKATVSSIMDYNIIIRALQDRLEGSKDAIQ